MLIKTEILVIKIKILIKFILIIAYFFAKKQGKSNFFKLKEIKEIVLKKSKKQCTINKVEKY